MKKILFIITLSILLAVFSNPTTSAFAQEDFEDWSAPINVSRSGGASEPSLIVDTSGNPHMVWLDRYYGYTYAFQKEGAWSTPALVNFPFTPEIGIDKQYPSVKPLLVSAPNNVVHAFWRDKNNALNYSRSLIATMGSRASWVSPQRLYPAVFAMDAKSNDRGDIYLTFVKGVWGDQVKSGIYFVRYDLNGGFWSAPQLLYETPYFRTLSPEMANVRISVRMLENGQTEVFVVWDNRPRNKVTFMHSANGGQTWDPAVDLDSPEIRGGPVVPMNVRVGNTESEVLVLWQSDQAGESCEQYYQVSRDGGVTWEGAQRMMDEIQGCPNDVQVVRTRTGKTLVASRVLNQVYLLAWDGNRWSDLQPQKALSVFSDPETFNVVNLACQQVVAGLEDQIMAAGCDTGLGSDIWFTQRQAGDVGAWFTTDVGFVTPKRVTTLPSIQSFPLLIPDPNDVTHLFWLSPGQNGNNNTIHYSRWDGETWLTPQEPFNPFSRQPGQPAATITSDGRLLVAWTDLSTGELFTTSVTANLAGVGEEWQRPVPIPDVNNAGAGLDLSMDADGVLHLIFPRSVNEGRGIYLLESRDNGVTWSQPQIVFNAESSGWAKVDMAQFAQTTDGTYHVLWTRYNSTSGSIGDGLYYTASDDDGQTWREVQAITGGSVGWSSLSSADGPTVHIAWEGLEGENETLYHVYSSDNGVQWSPPVAISTSGEASNGAASLAPVNGVAHIFQLVQNGTSNVRFVDWEFMESQWVTVNNVTVSALSQTHPGVMASVMSPHGRLDVVYSIKSFDVQTNEELETLYYINREMDGNDDAADGASGQGAAIVIPTRTVEPTVTLEATEIASNANEVREDFLSDPMPTAKVKAPSRWIGFMIGTVVALGAIIALMISAVRRRNPRRR